MGHSDAPGMGRWAQMRAAEKFPDGLLERAVELGAVTDRSVRVWLRQPGTAAADGTLHVDDHEAVHASVEVHAERDWTAALQFSLDGPAPGSAFRVEVAGEVRTGRLAPSPGQRTGLTFGFGSCNRPFELRDGEIRYHDAAGMYDAFTTDMERASASLLLLIGDQLYSDEIEPVSVRAGHLTEPRWLPTEEETVGAYREITRGYFNVSGFRRMRERFPTLMIWDDHDIFDNWGSRKEVSALDRRMFEAAARVYAEYQGSRNPEPQRAAPPFHYRYQYGDVGFFALDTRGMRDWNSGQMLGEEQWRDLVAYLDSPESDEIATLFLISSVPIGHVARWMADLFEHLPGSFGDSVRDRWSARAYREQRDELLARLLAWQQAQPGRQAIILSGDVHVAVAHTIRPARGGGKIEQFTSSAFTTPPDAYTRFSNVLAARGANLFEPAWRIERHFINYANNGGLVRLTPLDAGGHAVEFLVRAWNRQRGELRTAARRTVTPGDGV